MKQSVSRCILFLLVSLVSVAYAPSAWAQETKNPIKKIIVKNLSGKAVDVGVLLAGAFTADDRYLFKGEFHKEIVRVKVADKTEYVFDKVPDDSFFHKTLKAGKQETNVVWNLSPSVMIIRRTYNQEDKSYSITLISEKPEAQGEKNPNEESGSDDEEIEPDDTASEAGGSPEAVDASASEAIDTIVDSWPDVSLAGSDYTAPQVRTQQELEAEIQHLDLMYRTITPGQ